MTARLYNWTSWADGEPHELISGSDYEDVEKLRKAAGRYARSKELKVRVAKHGEESATVQFYKDGERPASTSRSRAEYAFDRIPVGTWTELVEGKDYAKLDAARRALYAWAKYNKMTAETRKSAKGIEVLLRAASDEPAAAAV